MVTNIGIMALLPAWHLRIKWSLSNRVHRRVRPSVLASLESICQLCNSQMPVRTENKNLSLRHLLAI